MYETGQVGGLKSSKTNGHVKTQPSETWDESLPVPQLKFFIAGAAVFSLAILCFINSHDGDFVFDDSEAVLNNKDILPETSVTDIFSHDFWGRKLDSKTSHKSYRPLTVLTFRWNYIWAGGLKPWGFHVVNIFLHGVVSVLFLHVFSVLFAGLKHDVGTGWPVFGAPKAALLSAVLFAVHPIHTESVAGVVGRADLLCALTFLLSFICYSRSCVNVYSCSTYRPESFSVIWLLVSMLLCIMSTFCKEQGITVIGICSVFDIIIVCQVDLLHLIGLRSQKITEENGHNNNNIRKKGDYPSWVKSVIYRHIILFLTGIFLLVTRWRVMGSAPPVFQVHDNPHSFVNGTLYRALNYNYLYAINSWLLLNPTWLCFDWSMGCVPVITSLTDLRILTSVAFWVMIASLLFRSFHGSLKSNERVLITSLALLIVPFLPASNVFFRVGFVIAERILYLSTAGFCMLVVLGAKQLSLVHSKQFVKAGLIILILMFTLKSIQRSYQWRTEMSLFTAGENICPLNAKVHYNIAKLQADNKNEDYAIEKYRLAVKLNPEYDQAMNNLGNILKDTGKPEEAEEMLTRAVTVRPEFAAAWMNLGIVQAAIKKYELAEKSYLTALVHRHRYPDCYYNLGNMYLDVGRHAEALTAWRNATLLKPAHVNAWTNTLILLDNQGRFQEALIVGKEAVKILKNEPQVLFNMANIYGKMENYKESEEFFLRAIKLDNSSRFHLNLGVLYHRWGKFDKAEASYKKAQELDPSNQSIQENLNMLYRKIAKSRA